MQQFCSKHRSSEYKSYLRTIAELDVSDLPELSPSFQRRLKSQGIDNVEQIVTEWSERRFMIEGYWIGRGSIEQINTALANLGLKSLGKEVPRDRLELVN